MHPGSFSSGFFVILTNSVPVLWITEPSLYKNLKFLHSAQLGQMLLSYARIPLAAIDTHVTTSSLEEATLSWSSVGLHRLWGFQAAKTQKGEGQEEAPEQI